VTAQTQARHAVRNSTLARCLVCEAGQDAKGKWMCEPKLPPATSPAPTRQVRLRHVCVILGGLDARGLPVSCHGATPPVHIHALGHSGPLAGIHSEQLRGHVPGCAPWVAQDAGDGAGKCSLGFASTAGMESQGGGMKIVKSFKLNGSARLRARSRVCPDTHAHNR
jgi:hypothetical protein